MICSKIVAIGMHIASFHAPDAPLDFQHAKYNNFNPGVYARLSCGIQAGVFYNSKKRMSVYGAYILENDKQPLFLMVGASTGYNEGFLVPMAGVGVKINRFRILFTPRIKKYDTPYLLHLTIEF